jgi:hypothetical protein
MSDFTVSEWYEHPGHVEIVSARDQVWLPHHGSRGELSMPEKKTTPDYCCPAKAEQTKIVVCP